VSIIGLASAAVAYAWYVLLLVMLGNHSLIHYPPGPQLLPPVRGLKTAFRQKAHVHAVPEVVPD